MVYSLYEGLSPERKEELRQRCEELDKLKVEYEQLKDKLNEKKLKNEDLDYFGFCSNLNVSPDLMSFKLYSLMKRGHAYHMPMEIQSNFLAK